MVGKQLKGRQGELNTVWANVCFHTHPGSIYMLNWMHIRYRMSEKVNPLWNRVLSPEARQMLSGLGQECAMTRKDGTVAARQLETNSKAPASAAGLARRVTNLLASGSELRLTCARCVAWPQRGTRGQAIAQRRRLAIKPRLVTALRHSFENFPESSCLEHFFFYYWASVGMIFTIWPY